MSVAGVLAALLWATAFAHGQTAWNQGSEAPTQPAWRDEGGDAQYRLLRRERVADETNAAKGCEWLQIEGNGGSYVYFGHDAGRPQLIDDLALSVWLRSDRPGLQIAVRVVLPRTADPQSGQHLTAIVSGPSYTDAGRWQQLQITDLPKLLTRQLHLLRMKFGSQVDGAEAYVDAVLVNVYGGPGVTNVWIGDLQITGNVAADAGPASAWRAVVAPAATASATPPGADPLVPVRLPPVQPVERSAYPAPTGAMPMAAAPAKRHVVKLAESVLQVDDRPILPRVVQHCGEPLSALKKLGFNTVWLRSLPTPEILEEADRLGLWLICPPPRGLTPLSEIGPAFDRVLVWDLGGDLTGAECEAVREWADQVRAADRRGNRPLICSPRTDLAKYSRGLADLLLLDRRPLGTSLELAEYGQWLRRQPLLASPGTPVWATVQTQPNEAVRQQLAVLEPGLMPPTCVSCDQLRLLTYTAVAAGSRGLVFLSDSPLDATNPQTQQRAMSLELLNLELDVIEPWAAAGTVVAGDVETNAPDVVTTLLRAEHAQLALPICAAPLAQYVSTRSPANALTLVVPGVSEASNAYELTPAGAQPLRHPVRGPGGARIALEEFGLTAQVAAGPRTLDHQRDLRPGGKKRSPRGRVATPSCLASSSTRCKH